MWGQTQWHFSTEENLALADNFSSALMRIDAMEETAYMDIDDYINRKGVLINPINSLKNIVV